MPLINLQTNLKSFKYGHDRPGGGDSGQPFITTTDTGATSVSVGSRNILRLFGIRSIPSIPNLSVILNKSKVGRITNEILSGDEFIRGGALGAAQASLNDTLRIGAFLLSVPKGPLFIAKQVGLQLSNPKLEVKKGVRGVVSGIFNPGGLLGTLTGGALGPTRIYNLGLNTIAQVPVNAFGGHFVRHGILPIQNNDTKYESVVAFNNNSNNSKQNRLVELANKFELGDNNLETNQGIFRLSAARKASRDAFRASKKNYRRATSSSGLARANIFRTLNTFQGPNAATNPNPAFLPSPNISSFPSNTQFLSPGAGHQPFGTQAFNIPTNVNVSQPITKKSIQKPKRNRITSTNRNVDFYLGGPGSVYGVGFTLINRYQFTEDIDKYQEAIKTAHENSGKGLDLASGQRKELTNSDILENAIGEGTINSLGQNLDNAISDYDGVVTDIKEIAKGINIGIFPTYAALVSQIDANQQRTNYNIANVTRNGIGTVVNSQTGSSGFSSTTVLGGKIAYTNTYGETVIVNKSNWSNASRAVRVGSGRKDSINLTPLFKTSTGQDGSVVIIPDATGKNQITLYTINDLCKFRIEAIDTDDPSQSVFMVFRAYLTDLSDSVDATWNDVKYAGRGEKFYVYDGFSRKINVGFKVAALSADEMEPMYQKLNYLMGNLMPDYKDTLMRGPLVRMTIGNWIDSQPGVLNSLSYTVPQDSPWEIALNEPITVGGVKKSELILPHVVDVKLTFTPIGSQTQTDNKKPEKVKDNNVSHIAQNYNGASEYNYIDSNKPIQPATFPGGDPFIPY